MTMNIKLLTAIGLLLFISFVSLYRINTTKQKTASTATSHLEIKLSETLDTISTNSRTKLSWTVIAPNDFETTSTSIYYSQTSSPSAVTKLDSPDAVGYQFSFPDYKTGIYKLPDNFEVYTTFSEPGVYYLRAYALVRGNHLWTEEKKITVTNTQ